MSRDECIIIMQKHIYYFKINRINIFRGRKFYEGNNRVMFHFYDAGYQSSLYSERRLLLSINFSFYFNLYFVERIIFFTFLE